jgi:drug/metabolite transporter (DMT)-like permease
MGSLSRRLARLDLVRTAAFLLGGSVVLALAAYGFASAYSVPTPGEIVAGLAALGIVGSGLMYAWRPGTGGLGD